MFKKGSVQFSSIVFLLIRKNRMQTTQKQPQEWNVECTQSKQRNQIRLVLLRATSDCCPPKVFGGQQLPTTYFRPRYSSAQGPILKSISTYAEWGAVVSISVTAAAVSNTHT